MARITHWLGTALIPALLLPVAAVAQQQLPAAGAQPATPAAQRTTRTPPKDTAAAPTATTGGSDAALRKRVEQLEEQLVDLQVVIGTLESLAKSPGASASAAYRAPANGSGGDQARIDGIEMQIRALTQQMEQLSAEVRGAAAPKGNSAALQPATGAMQPNAGVMPPAKPEQFGSTKVAPAAADSIEGILDAPPPVVSPAPPVASPPPTGTSQIAAYPAGDDPKLAYEAAYGQMLQQDYGGAQAGFGDFLKRFPNHGLVPNALYWLGETYYVQKNYADAAEAFDIVLSAHGNSNKAPDSQLKKAMSLSQQGKNADACTALRQLAAKFPNAPSHVKSKADSERRRVGCT